MVMISVVTIVKEHASGLAMTHESLLGQDFSDWEMVIVVGESKDNTLATASELQLNDSRIRAIEQNGFGIYGAMNEALDAVNGEYIWFMNAGDKFANNSVMTHATGELERHNAAIVIGGYKVESETARTYSFPFRRISRLNFAFNRRGGCHQAMIFRNQTLQVTGGFNLKYSLAADFDMVLKIMESAKVIRVPEIYASIEPGGRADQGITQVYRQKHEIRRELLGGPFIFFASILWTCLARIKIATRFHKIS